jgi:hypothetical protein
MTSIKEMRVRIVCPEYKGYIDEMPEDLRVIREARLKKQSNNKEPEQPTEEEVV